MNIKIGILNVPKHGNKHVLIHFVTIIGRGFAECQILKKGKMAFLLNWVEYFDKLLRKHWY